MPSVPDSMPMTMPTIAAAASVANMSALYAVWPPRGAAAPVHSVDPFPFRGQSCKIARMSSEEKKSDLASTVLSAASGYAVIVLSIVCFIVALIVIAAIVRIVVGASAGV